MPFIKIDTRQCWYLLHSNMTESITLLVTRMRSVLIVVLGSMVVRQLKSNAFHRPQIIVRFLRAGGQIVRFTLWNSGEED